VVRLTALWTSTLPPGSGLRFAVCSVWGSKEKAQFATERWEMFLL